MKKQNLTIGKRLKVQLEPEDEYDKITVAVDKCGAMVGHLSKGTFGDFSTTTLLFLNTSDGNYCHNEVIGKKVNLDKEEELQIPCTIHFTGEKKYFNKLKVNLFSLK